MDSRPERANKKTNLEGIFFAQISLVSTNSMSYYMVSVTQQYNSLKEQQVNQVTYQ